MIYDLITFGGFIFWTVVAVMALTFIWAVSSHEPNGDKLGISIGLTVVFGLALFCFSDLPELDVERALMTVGAYLVSGLVYASTRWYLLLRDVRACVTAPRKPGMSPADQRREIMGELSRRYNVHSFPPTAASNSKRLWFWSVYWPVDMLELVLTGPVNFIYDRFVMVFSAMARSMFKNVELPDDPR